MNNIHRAILPNISISHGTVENVRYLFSKVLDCAPVVWAPSTTSLSDILDLSISLFGKSS